MEINFCRRCGTPLAYVAGNAYKCQKGHTIFVNSAPAVGLLITRGDQLLLLERAIDPGKGKLDAPGGFCDGAENLEAAIARELLEETSLKPTDYSAPEFLLSAADPYPYGSEETTALGAIFTAHMLTDAVPVPADDAATARFIRIQDIDPADIYFPSVRAAVARLQGRHSS
ncbi:MAG TPA: NUDIX domain-containing protein [Candidatus Saccharimonadales bacterium]|nr:NUDIX domain-containing protein [Candidatus Saccharimonadales bacterium]